MVVVVVAAAAAVVHGRLYLLAIKRTLNALGKELQRPQAVMMSKVQVVRKKRNRTIFFRLVVSSPLVYPSPMLPSMPGMTH